LLLVYGALLVIVGVTASGQSALVSADAQATLLNSAVNADAALVRSYVSLAGLTPGDLSTARQDPARAAALDRGMAVMRDRDQILTVAILTPDGTVLASSDAAAIGQQVPRTDGLTAAVNGQTVDASIVSADAAGAFATLGTPSVLREYLPIILDGKVLAVVAIWRDAAPILHQLEEGRLHVVAITLSAALACAVILFFIFRSAQQRLTRQTVQLLEATRRDPLTGLLNHGAIVEALVSTVAAAGKDARLGVALLDIDGLGLLNATYGHPAGDRALTEVSQLIGAHLSPGMTCGRYGPDEFLVIASGDDVPGLELVLDRLRDDLCDLALRFDSSERLPVTFSAGICFYPTNGESVTTLLSVVAMTLDGAKASGGDASRVAEAEPLATSYAKTFDVLQGLIIAVDTKDRYTRRHSEDVARYADFIAELLGLDRETRRALHAAGLLHDVGKIGIPDVILRKPARLTEEEYGIVQQHVALGDMIVRDLPNIELIRAGVRHHHERWDGHGYLDHLAGEEIPVVARILAVGDAFSAMTTTRPYRKALSVDEALTRLEDGSGTQFDEHLARVFVTGIRTAANPPLPGHGTTVATIPPGERRVA